MSKIIIGIHGLANKPPKKLVSEWWQSSIREGLEKNCKYTDTFSFKMIYWADLLYKRPLHSDPNFDFDALFNDEPYYECKIADLGTYDESLIDTLVAGSLDIVGDSLDGLKKHFGMDALADFFLRNFLKDLAFYYDENRMLLGRPDRNRQRQQIQAKQALKYELIKELRKHKAKEVLLIAHSMGSIIAYDALRDIGRSREAVDKDLNISHFISIGSPLGLPHVRGKITDERDYDGNEKRVRNVRTPSIVTNSWKNFSDKKDPVAMDVMLKGDFHPNAQGIHVEDDLIDNDYRKPTVVGDGLAGKRDPQGEKNHHKSYGYLRSPEVSRHIKDFLAG